MGRRHHDADAGKGRPARRRSGCRSCGSLDERCGMSHPALPRALTGLPWRVLLVIAAIGLFGLIILFSAAGGKLAPWAANQGIRFAAFFVAMIALSRIRPERWSAIAFPAYAILFAALIAVEEIGRPSCRERVIQYV